MALIGQRFPDYAAISSITRNFEIRVLRFILSRPAAMLLLPFAFSSA